MQGGQWGMTKALGGVERGYGVSTKTQMNPNATKLKSASYDPTRSIGIDFAISYFLKPQQSSGDQ